MGTRQRFNSSRSALIIIIIVIPEKHFFINNIKGVYAMNKIERELKSIGVNNHGARWFRNNYPRIYELIQKECQGLGFPHPKTLLAFYYAHGTLQIERSCVICGNKMITVSVSKTCSRRCANALARINHPDLDKRSSESRRLTYLKMDKNILSQKSRLAYQKRIENGTYKDAIKRQRESRKKTYEARKEKKIKRIEDIILKNKLRLLMRISFLYSGLATIQYNAFVKKLKPFQHLLPDDYNYAYERLQVVLDNRCIICNEKIANKQTYCSYECVNKCEENRKKIGLGSKLNWEKDTYRENVINGLKSYHANRSVDEKKQWAKNILKRMGEDGLVSRRDKALETKLEKGLINGIYHKRKDPVYQEYKRQVARETRKSKNNIDMSNIGKHSNHVDHIFPIAKGYMYNIPPKLIGSIDNLRVIDALTNRAKSDKIETIPETILDYIKENSIVIKD